MPTSDRQRMDRKQSCPPKRGISLWRTGIETRILSTHQGALWGCRIIKHRSRAPSNAIAQAATIGTLRPLEHNMSAAQRTRAFVMATAHEVLLKFGLAFLVDDQGTTWAVTRSMDGPGLDTLRSGQRVQLTLHHRADFSLLRGYAHLT